MLNCGAVVPVVEVVDEVLVVVSSVVSVEEDVEELEDVLVVISSVVSVEELVEELDEVLVVVSRVVSVEEDVEELEEVLVVVSRVVSVEEDVEELEEVLVVVSRVVSVEELVDELDEVDVLDDELDDVELELVEVEEVLATVVVVVGGTTQLWLRFLHVSVRLSGSFLGVPSEVDTTLILRFFPAFTWTSTTGPQVEVLPVTSDPLSGPPPLFCTIAFGSVQALPVLTRMHCWTSNVQATSSSAQVPALSQVGSPAEQSTLFVPEAEPPVTRKTE